GPVHTANGHRFVDGHAVRHGAIDRPTAGGIEAVGDHDLVSRNCCIDRVLDVYRGRGPGRIGRRGGRVAQVHITRPCAGLELVGPHIHHPTDNARIAVQVSGAWRSEEHTSEL